MELKMIKNTHTEKIREMNQPSIINHPEMWVVGEKQDAKLLTELEPGQSGCIISVGTNTSECLKELAAAGLTPNAIVRIVDNSNTHLVFYNGDKKFVADKACLSKIMVKPLS
jgi:Fe2+ transport system protein FeoA